MGLIDLTTLRLRVRARADQENSQFVSDARLDEFINASADELYDLLVSKFDDRYSKGYSFNTVAGTEEYALPDDFYQLRGVDLLVDGQWRALDPFNLRERNAHRNRTLVTTLTTSLPRYWLRADKLHVLPIPTGALQAKLWYVPLRTQLVVAADTLDGVNGWEEWVVVHAAIKCLQKEESDTTELERELARITARIDRSAEVSRDTSPKTITNVEVDESWEF